VWWFWSAAAWWRPPRPAEGEARPESLLPKYRLTLPELGFEDFRAQWTLQTSLAYAPGPKVPGPVLLALRGLDEDGASESPL
jgi:hypothetical protein